MTEWMDREAALAALGVRAQTLYAYVSRGRIGMRSDPADPRRSLYRADDIAGLTARRARGRRPAAIAASAIAWGEPSIATGISTVIHSRLIFRGQDAADFAAQATLEQAASLLWDQAAPPSFMSEGADVGQADLFVAIAGLVAAARPNLGRSQDGLCVDAAAVIGRLALAVGAVVGAAPVHERLSRSWSLDNVGTDIVRRALVLLADHELNASTFAVRVAASTGASIAASLLAGLGTLSGPRHGGAGAAVTALVEDAERLGVEPAIARWLARDQLLPGFGHPLYPHGDPRASALLERIGIDDLLASLQEAVADATGGLPNIDFALAALTRAFHLPADAPFRLFALGRSIGWAAHAMEQAATGRLIRPRAYYEGREG
jgi:citrate synthase